MGVAVFAVLACKVLWRLYCYDAFRMELLETPGTIETVAERSASLSQRYTHVSIGYATFCLLGTPDAYHVNQVTLAISTNLVRYVLYPPWVPEPHVDAPDGLLFRDEFAGSVVLYLRDLDASFGLGTLVRVAPLSRGAVALLSEGSFVRHCTHLTLRNSLLAGAELVFEVQVSWGEAFILVQRNGRARGELLLYDYRRRMHQCISLEASSVETVLDAAFWLATSLQYLFESPISSEALERLTRSSVDVLPGGYDARVPGSGVWR